ncbi:proline dehydrogenase [Streptomyces sp. SAS_260]|uniref:proline dehydrogenase n=1 Tax=Streptomyces sp. SAS_260 TaxID=3412751 RepID=UPI00403CBF7E
MDAGLAALLGAAVGSLTTLAAAVVSGRAQARAQHDQWRRQHRRDAYASYLSALHDRDIAMDAILEALRSDNPDLPDVDEKTRRFVALAREVHRAAEVVILEGPVSLTEVVSRITHASSDLSEVMRRMVESAHAGDNTRRAEDTALAAERERILYQAVKNFRLAARSVIDSTNRHNELRPERAP